LSMSAHTRSLRRVRGLSGCQQVPAGLLAARGHGGGVFPRCFTPLGRLWKVTGI
jgi:hypothetical protein